MSTYVCQALTPFFLEGMAANPVVIAKANQLFPHLSFDFMTWFKGSVVPSATCAIFLPLLLKWSLSIDKLGNKTESENGDAVVKHAQLELDKMGSVSKKEWVNSLPP